MRGRQPDNPAYPAEAKTIGDHLRRRRLDLGQFQKEVAEQIGVDANTITNWELNRTKPKLQYLPAIIAYLGYLPFESGNDFSARLKAYRLSRGLSQEMLARELGINESTLWKWENRLSLPSRRLQQRLKQIALA